MSEPTLPPPLYAGALPRAALVARVLRALEQRVVQISAPFGAGKSSLLRALEARLGRPLVRVRMDHRSGDASFFFWQVQRALGLAPDEQAPDPETPLERIRQLAAALDDRPPLVLALDGAEVLQESPTVIELVGRLAQRLPAGVTLLVCARDPLPLPLGPLADGDEVVRIGADALELDTDEVGALVEVLAPGARLSAAQLAAARTALRGRALAAALFGAALRHRPADTLIAAVSDAGEQPVAPLLDVLLAAMPREHADWLERASVLDGLTAAVLDPVTGQPGSAPAQLAAASALGLVEPGEHPPVFPSSVRDALSRRLAARPEDWRETHARAASVLRSAGDAERALHHLIEAGAIEEAVGVMITVGHSIVTFNRIHALERLLRELPADAIEANPVLRFTRGSIRVIRLQVEGARADLTAAAEGAEAAGLEELANAARARLGYIGVFQGDLAATLRECGHVTARASDLSDSVVLQAHTLAWLAAEYTGDAEQAKALETHLGGAALDYPEALNVLSTRAWVARLHGDWETVRTLGLQGVRAAQESRAPGGLCFLLPSVAQGALGLGRAEEALDIAEEAEAISRSMSETWWELVALTARLVALVDLGRHEEAREAGRKLVSAAREYGGLHWTEAEAWLELARIPGEDREEALREAELATTRCTHPPLQTRALLERARLALDRERLEEADKLLDDADRCLGEVDARPLRADWSVLRARRAAAGGAVSEAAALLAPLVGEHAAALERERRALLPALVRLARDGERAVLPLLEAVAPDAVRALARHRGRAADALRSHLLDIDAGALEVASLGGFRVQRTTGSGAAVTVTFRTPRVGDLFRRLLVAGEAVPRDVLLESLWPGEPLASARRSLNTHLTYLRRALEPDLPARTASRYVLREGDSYRLDLRGGRWDAERFRIHAQAGLAAHRDGDVRAADSELGAALAAYGGPLWGEPVYLDSLAAPRDELARLFQRAGFAAAEAARELGNPMRAREGLEALLREDPLAEPATLLAMELEGELGNPAGVRTLYERLRRALRTELETEPSPEARAAAARLMR